MNYGVTNEIKVTSIPNNINRKSKEEDSLPDINRNSEM